MQTILKGYNTYSGYMGWIEWENEYRLFACERDYVEYVCDGGPTKKVFDVKRLTKKALNYKEI